MSSISVLIGLLIVIGSILANAIMGTQIALIGVGFILIGIFIETRKAAKALSNQ